HACGGGARCSTCRVMILEGLEHCTPPTEKEKALTDRLGFSSDVRLACETLVQGNVVLRRLALDDDDRTMILRQFQGKITPIVRGTERKIAILFSDLRGFTSFSEKLPPYDVVYVLNRYFYRMGQIVERYGGMINNYIGDGMLALFGLTPTEGASERAVLAALDMADAMESLNDYLDNLYHRRLGIGIGIHFGTVVMGDVGAPGSQRLTVIGDTVNFASRIEAANKQLGTTVLISEAVYQQVKDMVKTKPHYAIQVPGKTGNYDLYEVTASLLKPIVPEPPLPPRSLLSRLVATLLRWWNTLWRSLGC
ncbi:MAG: adenylate/guanylate cyclase domain-containing protein, partial [Cyanobacteriota bacterium SKYGB_h_bin112]|nr:adenylate/guanylate cyclase domain-containing protein [Cyanobacteriota bacterium SKYGB_h_bin112]